MVARRGWHVKLEALLLLGFGSRERRTWRKSEGKKQVKKKAREGRKRREKKSAGGSGGWLIGWGPGVDATSCLIVFHTCLTAVHSCN